MSIQPTKKPVSPRRKRSRLNRREQFFWRLKHDHCNLYALYLMVSIVSIWSGCWYLGDTWAQGQDLLAPTAVVGWDVVLRHGCLLMLGLFMLYVDDQSLQELVLMKACAETNSGDHAKGSNTPLKTFKRRYPNLAAIYTYLGIIASWCGTWGLLWDIPIQPCWRSLLTISLGFLLLYIDDFKLTEI